MRTGVYRVCLSVLAPLVLLTGCGDSPSPGAPLDPEAGSTGGVDYVNVRYEPQHRHEFENEHLRIYDVLLPPGYVTLYHAHFLDTLYAVVQGSKLKSKAVVGSGIPLALPVPTGTLMWNQHTDEPLIHEVVNAGDGAARLLGVEFKNPVQAFTRLPLAGQGLTLTETYPRVRVYELNLAAGASTGVLDIQFFGLMIAMTEASLSLDAGPGAVRVVSVEPASWQLLHKPGAVKISNIGDSTLKALIYELP